MCEKGKLGDDCLGSEMVMPSAELTWAPVLREGWVARLGSSCRYLTKDDGCWSDQGSGIGDAGMWWVLPSFSRLTQLNILMDSTWGVRHRGHRFRCSRFWGLRLGFLCVNIKDYLLDFQAEMLRKQLGMKLRKEVWDQIIDLVVGTCLVVSFNVFNSGVSLGRGERAWAPVASKPRGCREEKQDDWGWGREISRKAEDRETGCLRRQEKKVFEGGVISRVICWWEVTWDDDWESLNLAMERFLVTWLSTFFGMFYVRAKLEYM